MSASLIGQSVGRYHVVEQLGEGGMAAVYRAYDTRLEREVALKVIHPTFQASPEFMKRFEREAKAMAKFSHPNIVNVHDYGDHQGMPYLVMEYLSGGTLKPLLGQPMPPAEAARLLIPVARALEFAHRSKVVHRDVKPANILISVSGEPMLTDFGIAKLLEAEGTQALTGTGVGIGTPEYMAPEQGMGATVDHRVDIYALGVVFYELVTGRRPYRADTPMAVMLKKMREPLPNPRDFVPDMPEAVSRTIFKAMARDPENRYQDMGVLIQALETLLTGGTDIWEGVTLARSAAPAVPPLAADGTGSLGWLKRNPWIAAVSVLGLAVVGCVALLLGGWLSGALGGDSAPAAEEVAEVAMSGEISAETTATTSPSLATGPMLTPTETLVPSSTPFPTLAIIVDAPASRPDKPITASSADQVAPLLYWGKGQLGQIAYSPDGSLVAAATSLGVRLYDARTLKDLRLTSLDSEAISLAFSPDCGAPLEQVDGGDCLLAVGLKDRTIRLLEVIDGNPVATLEGHESYVYALAFSPDGTTLASAAGDKKIMLWSIPGGAPVAVLEGHIDDVKTLAYSPDSKALVSGSSDGTVRIWDADSGQLLRTLEGHEREVASLAFSRDGKLLASGDTNKTLLLWDTSSWALVRTFEGHKGDVTGIAFLPGGETLATAASDGIVRLWRLEDGAMLQTLEGHSDDVVSLALSPDCGTSLEQSDGATCRLASGAENGEVYLWDASSGERLAATPGWRMHYWKVIFSTDGNLLYAGANKYVDSWYVGSEDAQAFSEARMIYDPGENVINSSLALSPDAKILAVGDNYGKVRLWGVADGAFLKLLDSETLGGDTEALTFLEEDNTLVVAGGNREDAYFVTWDVAAALEKAYPIPTRFDTKGMAFSPDHSLLAVSSQDDDAVRIYQVSSGSQVSAMGCGGDVESVAFSSDGSLLATGSYQVACVYTTSDWTTVVKLPEEHKSWITSVAFSQDGSLLATGGMFGLINLWRVSDWTLLATLEGHNENVLGLAFSPDGALLASASRDGTVRLWGVP